MSIGFWDNIDISGNKVINSGAPTSSGDLANKSYVDGLAPTAGSFISVTSGAVAVAPLTGSFGDGVLTSFTVNVPSNNVITAVYNNSTNQAVNVTTTVASNVVTFSFLIAPTTNQFRYVII
jgi:hypothetical protein